MAQTQVVEAARAYLLHLRHLNFEVSFGVLFGSHAKGNAGPWSDIDLIVVSPTFDREKQRSDIDLLWTATLEADERIEPVPCGVVEWTDDDSRTIVEIARREGQIIELDKAA
jgi:predicted nucleotidyltransferase